MSTSQKCQLCNNQTRNPSGRCWIHESAPEYRASSAVRLPVPSAARQVPDPDPLDEPYCFVCGRATDHSAEHDDLVDEGRARYERGRVYNVDLTDAEEDIEKIDLLVALQRSVERHKAASRIEDSGNVVASDTRLPVELRAAATQTVRETEFQGYSRGDRESWERGVATVLVTDPRLTDEHREQLFYAVTDDGSDWQTSAAAAVEAPSH